MNRKIRAVRVNMYTAPGNSQPLPVNQILIDYNTLIYIKAISGDWGLLPGGFGSAIRKSSCHSTPAGDLYTF